MRQEIKELVENLSEYILTLPSLAPQEFDDAKHLVVLESLLAFSELRKLLEKYAQSNVLCDERTLKPFFDYLNNRYDRIRFSDAFYTRRPEKTPINLVCMKLALYLAEHCPLSVSQIVIPSFQSDAQPQRDAKIRLRKHLDKGEVSLPNGNGLDRLKLKLYPPQMDVEKLVSELLKYPKSTWEAYLSNVDIDDLKIRILDRKELPEVVQDSKLYNGKDDHDRAILFILLHIYSRLREEIGKEYKSLTGSWTGYSKTAKLSSAQAAFEFLLSDKKLEEFAPVSGAMSSGTLGFITRQISRIRQPEFLDLMNKQAAPVKEESHGWRDYFRFR